MSINPFRVTCTDLVEKDGVLEQVVVFATSEKFPTRETAAAYAETVDPGRDAKVAHTGSLLTEKTPIGWSCWDDNSYDGAPDGDNEIINCAATEIEALFDFCEQFDRCYVNFFGVPCGGSRTVDTGEGYPRCDGCGML